MSTEEDHMLLDFGKDHLDNDMFAIAEKFLIKVISKKLGSCNTFNELIHIILRHNILTPFDFSRRADYFGVVGCQNWIKNDRVMPIGSWGKSGVLAYFWLKIGYYVHIY